jgi:hypothetical protein
MNKGGREGRRKGFEEWVRRDRGSGRKERKGWMR